jgi:SSS family solute:Na+ symporter
MISGTLGILDIVVITAYFIFIVYLGFRYRKSSSAEGYFLASRSVSWPVVGFSMFAASISSSTLIGQSGDAYSTGIGVFNYSFLAIIVMLVFVWFILPFYIKSGVYTIPEFFGRRFDPRSRYYFSAITIIINVFLDAAGALYAAALVMKLVFPDVSLQVFVIIFGLIVAAYTIPGGLSSAMRVDLIQGIVLTVGAICLTVIISLKGGASYIVDMMKNNDITMKLVRPMSDPSVPWLGMILGIPILGLFFWTNNQQLVQRVLSSKSLDDGRKGVLMVGFLTLLTLFIIIIPGVMAREFFPGLEKSDMVYPSLIINMLPVGVVGFLLAALLAALTSSLSGLLNSVATLFTMDFYKAFNKGATPEKQVKVGRIVSVIVLIIAVLWAPQIGTRFSSLVKYYQEMLSMLAPPVVAAFMLGLFWKRINATAAFYGMIIGAVPGLVNMIVKINTGTSIFGHIHFLNTVPIYMVFSILIMVICSYLTPAQSYDKINDLVWSKQVFREDTLSLKGIPFYKNYRFVSYLLLATFIVMLVIFW